ncbi:MAG: hypothetical protein COA96_14295 [SAR86 cluster bacterium]|uniref:Uncharacterized protein n=1 Tax=SAR86 cluster bacterium TaxID=2030880 RepID=A0A2A5AUF6_9GAMM|nr:MAG: hypothetical protein COA96_14295 [SAR86 cluster bacterium]
MLLLGLVFMAMTLFVFILYGLFAHIISASIVNTPRVITHVQRAFSSIFAILGVKLAFTDQ